MIKKAILMLGLWLAWSLWQRRKANPMDADDHEALAPLSPFPYPKD